MSINVSPDHYYALRVGTRLNEFEIVSVLGSGGFGITYLATDTLLDEAVALKEYLPSELAVRGTDATVRAKTEGERPDFEAGLRAFLEEARLLARFRHPNIVKVRRFFELHGTGYIVLDYEKGETLSRRLAREPMPETELRALFAGVLSGLEAVHQRAALHRDLKPNNIILREDGTPALIDFGAARDFASRHSRSVTAIAAPGYSPPEQYGVGEQQGPWTDLYALGAIAYRAVTGAAPVDSLRRLRKDPLVPATKATLVPAPGGYSRQLLEAIDWMLQIDEADRPQSVEDVRDMLGADVPAETVVFSEQTIRPEVEPRDNDAIAHVVSTPATAAKPRQPWRTAFFGIGLMAIVGLSIAAFALKQSADASKQQAAKAQFDAAQEAEQRLRVAEAARRLAEENEAAAEARRNQENTEAEKAIAEARAEAEAARKAADEQTVVADASRRAAERAAADEAHQASEAKISVLEEKLRRLERSALTENNDADPVRSNISRRLRVQRPDWCARIDGSNPNENLICDDPALARLDIEINTLYASTLASLSGSRQAQFKRNSVGWLRDRDNSCTGSRELRRSCLLPLMRERIERLGGAENSSFVGQTSFARPGWCVRAHTPAETLICGDPELSSLDLRLNQIYERRLAALAGRARDEVRRASKTWLEMRERNCLSGSLARRRSCLAGMMRSRISELARY
jgi:serine/threonine protein kinase/uncharacterized protein